MDSPCQTMSQAALKASVFAQFVQHANSTPHAVAVIDEAGSTTYSELANRADAVARHLLANGLVTEQPIGVLMGRRTELVAVLLGVWQAGGAYIPFDPNDPPERIRRMLLSCGVTQVIGDADELNALSAACESAGSTPPQTIDVSTITPLAATAEPLRCPDGGTRLAYLLFTSGSTGEPKAVEVEHRQVQALLQSAQDLLCFSSSDKYLAASTVAFDASVTELYLPLVTGASLVLRDRSILLDPHRLAREIQLHGITVFQTGPSVWQVILKEVVNFPRVRVAISHGEAVTPELARRIAAHGESAWNLYGPTETTVWATAARIRIQDQPGQSTTSAPLGRPLPHVRALILDDQGRPAPLGEAGELCLGGPSVARGYRNNELLTRQRFVTIGGERFYRSGDLVKQDNEGVLHYFGRNDDQIKVRGVRVEPGEVEAAILSDPRVAQTAVTWFATPGGTRAIVAAVVLNPGTPCQAQELHTQLTTKLPSTMIPTRFLLVPLLPMTSSGKTDRIAIRQTAETSVITAPESSSGESPGACTSPPGRKLSSTEQAVAQIWQRLLGVVVEAPDDHFFSIGGDSLGAVQMMVEIEARFGLVLPVHLAFESPTLESLSRRIERARFEFEEQLSTAFVFPLVSAGTQTPIYFSGVKLSLARRGVWNLPCPLYAINNWATGSGFVETKSLEVLAAAHLKAVRLKQPLGPYRLAGYSLGGLIAYEMAQQLREAGEEVEFLFLLDPMAPHHIFAPGTKTSVPTSTAQPALRDRIRRRTADVVRGIAQGPGENGFWAWLRMSFGVQTLSAIRLPPMIGWIYYSAVNRHLRRPTAVSKLLFPRNRWRAFWFAAQRMVRGYTARSYDGPLLALFSRQGTRSDVWNSLLGPDAIQEKIDASHYALFEEPALGEWMRRLSEYSNTARHAEDQAMDPSTSRALPSQGL